MEYKINSKNNEQEAKCTTFNSHQLLPIVLETRLKPKASDWLIQILKNRN